MGKDKKSGQRLKKKDLQGLLMDMFQQAPGETFDLKTLYRTLNLKTHPAKMLMMDVLDEMLMDDYIKEHPRYHFSLNTPSQVMEGTFRRKANGKNVFEPADGTEPILVAERNSMHAMDGDKVQATMVARRRNHVREAVVTEIVERADHTFVGTLEVKKDFAYLLTEDRTLANDIFIPKSALKKGKDGDKAVVKITEWPENAKNPVGHVIDILGKTGENNAEMHAILAEYGLPYKYPAAVEKAADKLLPGISAEELAKREDMREVMTFTIDPRDAKDFDDALSVRKVRDGVWEVGVHIADVTHYVRPGSVVDTEAEARGTSVYLVDRTVPMLPERLCNELCSLRPHEESLCFSAVFTLNENLEILDEWFGRTGIYSDRRFAYEEAQQVIETGRGDYAEEILTLNRLAQAMRRERFRNGAISFDRAEAKFRLDEKGRPLGVYFKEQKEANQMIEEFMLLANRRVAEFCGKVRGRKSGRTMVYRVHDEPNVDKLQSFRQFILRFGHVFKASEGRPVAKEMNKLFQKVKGRPEENVVTTLAVRSMAKAYYTTDNIGHYGLAFPYYTHFTSPIRRYPDMMVHRLLARYLEGGKTTDKATFEALCEHASEREVIAAEAERASIKYKMVEFMQARLGEEFAGHISGITEWGIFVEIDENHIEGLVAMRDMHDDFYDFDPAEYTVTGRSTGRRFTLGDAVRIRVKRADLQKRQLDFDMVLPDAPRTDTPQRGRRSPQVKRRR